MQGIREILRYSFPRFLRQLASSNGQWEILSTEREEGIPCSGNDLRLSQNENSRFCREVRWRSHFPSKLLMSYSKDMFMEMREAGDGIIEVRWHS